MCRHRRISAQGNRYLTVLEVQTGMGCRRGNDSERLDIALREIGSEPTEIGLCASAERTVQPSEQPEDPCAPTEPVPSRQLAPQICRAQSELRGAVPRS